jgi:hypothetical protein
MYVQSDPVGRVLFPPRSFVLHPETLYDIDLIFRSFRQEQLYSPEREGYKDVQPAPEHMTSLIVDEE